MATSVSCPVVILILVLLTAFHDKIVKALTPAASHLHACVTSRLGAEWYHRITCHYRMKFGYLIPIGILIVLSFPPVSDDSACIHRD
jgi:hypothetical protein